RGGKIRVSRIFLGGSMLRKTWLAIVPAIVLAATFNVHGQAPEGQGRGEGRGEGRGQGRGEGAGQGRGEGAGRGAAPAAQAQAQAIKMVKPGLYMVTGAGGNSTVRVSDQGVILVDTKNLGEN